MTESTAAQPHAPRTQNSTQNVRVAAVTPLSSPYELEQQLSANDAIYQTVRESRQVIENILDGKDERLLVVVGPCSIHDTVAAREYAERLAELHKRLNDQFYVVMRVYFEKPRTTVGWKGLVNDPHLNGTFDMEEGLRLARKLLLDISSMGLPSATETLDPITPQYFDDLIAWSAIGARTTESQTHRQMASGFSMPVGFKNSTDGNLQVALDAMKSAQSPHRFLGIDEQGQTVVVHTTGNPYGHLILRGGHQGPNYQEPFVADATRRLQEADLPPRLMIDCSHANSGKQFERQPEVWHDVLRQRKAGDSPIVGTMIESNLFEGKQPITADRGELRYGVSITDGCIGWETTEKMLTEGYEQFA